MEPYHIPVMFDECMEALQVKDDGIYFDGTLGGGSHTAGILSRGGGERQNPAGQMHLPGRVGC